MECFFKILNKFDEEKEPFGRNLIFLNLISFIFSILINFSHEFGHWLACTIIGGACVFGLNNTCALTSIPRGIPLAFFYIAGPLVNITWAYLGMFLVLKKNNSVIGFITAIIASTSRLLVLIFSFLIPVRPKEYQDEYCFAVELGLSTILIFIISLIILTIPVALVEIRFKTKYESPSQRIFTFFIVIISMSLGMVFCILFDTHLLGMGRYT